MEHISWAIEIIGIDGGGAAVDEFFEATGAGECDVCGWIWEPGKAAVSATEDHAMAELKSNGLLA